MDDWRANTTVAYQNEDDAGEEQVVAWFWEMLESFTEQQKSRLLQYVTGSCGVPVEGFKVKGSWSLATKWELVVY